MIPILKKIKSLTFFSNYFFARNFKFPLQGKAAPSPQKSEEIEELSDKKDKKVMKQHPKNLDFLEKDFEKMMKSNTKILDVLI